MYQEYFGLTAKPFSETPNTDFFYLSSKHQEGLAHLEYNILDGKGFTLLIGEVGTGKTTLCRALIERLDKDKITVAHVIHTNLDFHEFLREVVEELGMPSQGLQRWDLLKALNQYLIEAYAQNRKVVLIVDEAQNLAPSVLEGVRMLSNLETPQEKLIQIVFVGQPGLMDRIQQPELLQLKQRIAGFFFLGPLTEKETKEYILFRMGCAQLKPSLRFAPEALDLIYRITGGVPRLINFLCDFSIMQAYVAESWTIDASLVQKAYSEIKGTSCPIEQKEAKEKRFEGKFQGIPRKDETGVVSLKPSSNPKMQLSEVDVEGIFPEEEEKFFFPEKKSIGKKIALAFGLVLTLGGLGSFLLWEMDLEKWKPKAISPAYQIKMPVSEQGGDIQSRLSMAEKKLSKISPELSD